MQVGPVRADAVCWVEIRAARVTCDRDEMPHDYAIALMERRNHRDRSQGRFVLVVVGMRCWRQ
jgi:hypothetical protein